VRELFADDWALLNEGLERTSRIVEAPGVERGSARALESVGAIGSEDSGEKSQDCAHTGGATSAPENGRECGTCSNVASRLTFAEVIDGVEAAIAALDSGEIETAKVRLQAPRISVRNPAPTSS